MAQSPTQPASQPSAPGYPFPRAGAQIPRLDPNVKRTLRFYVYSIAFSGLAAAVGQTGFCRIDAKFRFVCYGINAIFYTPGTGLGSQDQNCTVRYSDTTSGAYWSDKAHYIPATAGKRNAFHRFSVPMVIEKNTKIQADITPIAVSAARTDLYIAFIGAQIAEYN